MDTHKVCQIELCVRRAREKWSSFLEAGHRLSGKIIVCHEAAAVRVSLKCLIVKHIE